MIIDVKLNDSVEIKELEDLHKLKDYIDNGFKVNISKLAKELDCNWRTVKKRVNGFEKSKTRKRHSQLDDYYDVMLNMLNDEYCTFSYISVLYKRMVRDYNIKVSESNFRHYIRKHKELYSYFKKGKKNKSNGASVRVETDLGQQAQLDWKETIEFVLDTGEVIIVNVFVLLLSYSRFRVYRMSLTKTQDILFHFLDQSFEIFGGVPKKILTDNMKTVMDDSRTDYRKGKVNNKFQQFADDYGFIVAPCISETPKTKGKVEAQMKILEEVKAYSGQLSYSGLVALVENINNRENHNYHPSYQKIPVEHLRKEKDSLLPLPQDNIRSPYLINTKDAKVNQNSQISYLSNLYSLPKQYCGKTIKLQV